MRFQFNKKIIKITAAILLGVVFIFVASVAVFLWMDGWRFSDLKEKSYELSSSPSGKGLAISTLEKALPDGLLYLYGAKDLKKSLGSSQAAKFYQAFKEYQAKQAGNKGSLPELFVQLFYSDFKAYIGDGFIAAAYADPQAGPSMSTLILVSLTKDTSDYVEAKSFLAQILPNKSGFTFAIENNILMVSDNKNLIDETVKSIKTDAGSAPKLVAQAKSRIPAESSYFFIVNYEDVRSWKSGSGSFANSELPGNHISWLAGGFNFDKKGWWGNYWAEYKDDIPQDSLYRHPPGPLCFEGGLFPDVLLFFSSRFPLSSAIKNLQESVGKLPAASIYSQMLISQGEKYGVTFVDVLERLLYDEMGFFLCNWQGNQLVPRVAVYVRIKKPLEVWSLLYKNLTKERGWKREGKVFTYSFKRNPMLAQASVACALKKDILIFGEKEAVLKAVSPEGGVRPAALTSLNLPDAISGMAYFDIGAIVQKVLSSPLAAGPIVQSNPKLAQLSALKNAISWFPPLAGYWVNYKEGALFRLHWPVKKQHEDKWDELFTALKGLNGAKKTSYKTTNVQNKTTNVKKKVIFKEKKIEVVPRKKKVQEKVEDKVKESKLEKEETGLVENKYREAMRFYNAGNYRDAFMGFRAVLKIDPEHEKSKEMKRECIKKISSE